MAVRPSAQPQTVRTSLKLNPEVSDQLWNAMIIMALKYQRKIGRFYNQRYDRKNLYHVLIVCELARTLVDQGCIHSWAAGFRRLSDIEKGVIKEFAKLHGKTHLDP